MVLSRSRIKELLRIKYPQGLIVTPLLDEDQQIGKSSIDVRLGNEFVLVNRQTGMLGIDPIQRTELDARLRQYQRRIRIAFGTPFYLHPHDFCLARTLEYIALPNWISGYVIGRSSWGRLGLIIATATMIGPEFSGTIVLELANVGSVPVALYPIMRIAQLVLHSLEEVVGKSG